MTGNQLRERRKLLGLSQDLLAKELRVSRPTISAWEARGTEAIDHLVFLAVEALSRNPDLRSYARDGLDISDGGRQ
jgi:transcriptional regulator with XRE-family HTH domain